MQYGWEKWDFYAYIHLLVAHQPCSKSVSSEKLDGRFTFYVLGADVFL